MEPNSELNNIYNFIKTRYGIVGKSKPMLASINLLIQAAPTDLTVLITGETGTGKEIFANALHGLSNRKKFSFVSVNCSAIPETLLESELFGHEKGAFTGASDQRKGFFESAHHGTIFLDEIGEMPVGTQVKLLRVLESGEFSRLGSSVVHKVNVRVIAATNRDLEQEVEDRNFRKDLFFRLKSVNIKLPPLREHIDDLPLLSSFFAENISSKLNLNFQGFSDNALSILKGMHWPGNVRELKNLIDTLITLEEPEFITSEILRKYIAPALPPYSSEPSNYNNSLIRTTSEKERDIFELGLIFRTLLQIQNDVISIKNTLNNQNLAIEDIKMNIYSDHVNYTQQEIANDKNENLNLYELEKNTITTALQKHDGNRRLAASSLGISERTLYRKIVEYGIS
jgi:transcriptional regulator with PAS, ATPase and Fis domain